MSTCLEIAELKRLAGKGLCCFCLKPLKRLKRRQLICCWSADCRTELTAAYMRQRNMARAALISLRRVVMAIGCSTKSLMRLEP